MLNSVFNYLILKEYRPEVFEAEKVRFKKDFGPWKAGEFADIVRVDLEIGTMKTLSIDGIIIKQCNIKLEAI